MKVYLRCRAEELSELLCMKWFSKINELTVPNEYKRVYNLESCINLSTIAFISVNSLILH